MGENKKRMMEAINRNFEEGSEVMPVAESLYYMKAALLLHYGKKYPKQKAAITEVCEMIGRLLDEMARLQEDHARMTYTLRTIAGKAMDAMQGTARSQIAADWWQAQD